MQVRRLGGDVVIDLRHGHLDRRDVLADLVVVLVLVDQPGGAQHQQAEALHRDPAVGDLFLDHLQVGQSTVAGGARHRPLAHQVQRMAAGADRAHGVVYASAAQSHLGDDEGRTPVAQQRLIGQAHIGVADIPLIAAPDLAAGPHAHIAQDLHPGGVGGHQENRGAAVGVLGVRIGHRIEHQHLGMPGIGREPLLAVDHPVLAVQYRAGLEGQRVRAAGRFAHRKARADLAVQQRPQIPGLLRLGAVVRDDLGVAAVGGLATEHCGRQAIAAQLLVHQRELQLAEPLAAQLGPQMTSP